MSNPQHISGSSNSNQQILAGGDVTAPFVKDGGVAFGGDNHGIVITSNPTSEEQVDATSDQHPSSSLSRAVGDLGDDAGFANPGIAAE